MTPDEPAPSTLVLAPGAPPEAQTLLGRWHERWPGVDPWRSRPRLARPDAWVRFHTLPDGRQDLRTNRDARTVVRRFRRVVRAVEEVTGESVSVLLVDDPQPGWGTLRDEVRAAVAPVQPWVTHIWDEDEDEDEEDAGTEGRDEETWPPSTHSFRIGPLDDVQRAALALAAHRLDADFLLLPADLSWAVSAYDGGIDVVVRDGHEAAALAGRCERWLPPAGWVGAHSWNRRATQREVHRRCAVD